MTTKKKSNFEFVDDEILRNNLDITFDLVIALIPLSNSEDNTHTELVKIGFKKMIIISTASIIEALLLLLIKNKKSEQELSPRTEIFKVDKIIHMTDDKKRIVIGEMKETIEKCKYNKLNLKQIIDLCDNHNLIKDVILTEHLLKVKDLRNKQHLGTLKFVDSGYSNADLEFVFSVAKRVKELVTEKL